MPWSVVQGIDTWCGAAVAGEVLSPAQKADGDAGSDVGDDGQGNE